MDSNVVARKTLTRFVIKGSYLHYMQDKSCPNLNVYIVKMLGKDCIVSMQCNKLLLGYTHLLK